MLHITDLLPAQADLPGASAGIADGEDRDWMTFTASALEAAGTVADDAFEQGAAENVGGAGKARGQAVAALDSCTLMHLWVLSGTQTKKVRLLFLRQEVARRIRPPRGGR